MKLSDEEVSKIGNNLVDYFKTMQDIYINNYDKVHELVKKKKLEKRRLKNKQKKKL